MTATQKTREALMTALKAYPQSRSPSVKQLQRALDDSDARARKAVAAEPSGLYAVFKSLRTVRRSFRDATRRRAERLTPRPWEPNAGAQSQVIGVELASDQEPGGVPAG